MRGSKSLLKVGRIEIDGLVKSHFIHIELKNNLQKIDGLVKSPKRQENSI